jgi:hypothetical protein
MKTTDIAATTAAVKPRLPGRVMFLACLNCVQAIAPDWPLLILWPCIRISLTSSMVRWVRPMASGRKNRILAVARARTVFNKSSVRSIPETFTSKGEIFEHI